MCKLISTYDIICVVSLQGLDIVVNKVLLILARAAEFLLALEAGDWQESEFHHGDEAIALDNLRSSLSLADLLGYSVNVVEEINFARWEGLLVKYIQRIKGSSSQTFFR